MGERDAMPTQFLTARPLRVLKDAKDAKICSRVRLASLCASRFKNTADKPVGEPRRRIPSTTDSTSNTDASPPYPPRPPLQKSTINVPQSSIERASIRFPIADCCGVIVEGGTIRGFFREFRAFRGSYPRLRTPFHHRDLRGHRGGSRRDRADIKQRIQDKKLCVLSALCGLKTPLESRLESLRFLRGPVKMVQRKSRATAPVFWWSDFRSGASALLAVDRKRGRVRGNRRLSKQ